jgi:curli biogenesis system outer membrane secretion channel CsgG
MRSYSILLALLLTLYAAAALRAQELLPLEYRAAGSKTVQTLQFTISLAHDQQVYTTIIHVNKNDMVYKIINLRHDARSKTVTIDVSDATTGATEQAYQVSYTDLSGCVFTDHGDTVIPGKPNYANAYIISFDQPKTHANLHYIEKQGSYSLLFDMIRDELIEQNRQIKAQALIALQQAAALPPPPSPEELRLREMKRMQDSAAAVAAAVAEQLAAQRRADSIERERYAQQIEEYAIAFGQSYATDSARVAAKTAKVYAEMRRILAEKGDDGDEEYRNIVRMTSEKDENGTYGLMIKQAPADPDSKDDKVKLNSKIYVGYFNRKQFVSGSVVFKYADGYTYTGEYADAPQGFGCKQYGTDSMQLGTFTEGRLTNGTEMRANRNGNFFLGRKMDGKRNGFGVLGISGSGIYIGLYRDDRLMEGVVSQMDDVGASAYYKVHLAEKTPITSAEWAHIYQRLRRRCGILPPLSHEPVPDRVEAAPVPAPVVQQAVQPRAEVVAPARIEVAAAPAPPATTPVQPVATEPVRVAETKPVAEVAYKPARVPDTKPVAETTYKPAPAASVPAPVVVAAPKSALSKNLPVVGIPAFTCSGNYCNMENVLYGVVSNEFTSSGRFTVVERNSLGLIERERDLQKNEEFVYSKVVEQGRSLGADYIIAGSINSITATTTPVRNANGVIISYSYAGNVSFTLKQISVETGQVVNSKDINENNGMGGYSSFNFTTSPENALTRVMQTCGKAVRKWIAEVFPVQTSVLKVGESSESKGAKTLVIAGGSGVGLGEGTDVRIIYYEANVVDGKALMRPVELAEGKIIKIEDANFSQCKVKSNGQEVLRMINEGQKLYIITKN